MDFNSFQDQKTAQASLIGIDLDFYCKFSIKKVAEKFALILGSPVEVVNEDNFTPTKDKFFIIESFGYGKERYRFYSNSLPYSDSRQVLIKVFATIKEFGYTDNTCICRIDFSYNETLVPISIEKLAILRFILEFNEDMMWRFFPENRDSIYVKSIKNITPQNKFYRSENVNVSNFNYVLPTMEFFGVLFDRVKDGILQFRYIGGKDYEYKITEALDVIAIYNSYVSKCLFDPSYSDKNKESLKKVISNASNIIKAYESYQGFLDTYPDIVLTVDLEKNDQIIESKFVKFRDDIFNLLSSSDIKKGEINYDSSMSRIQLQGGEGHIYEITNWEFINCKLIIENGFDCNFFECHINDSSLNRCNLYRYSKVKNSRLKDTYINRTCIIEDTYIHGKLSTIEGKIEGGMINGGRMGIHSHVSKETEMIDYSKIYKN
jgi:hypothetical protein